MTSQTSPSFLSGGGAMGALIRAHPWHDTTLGSPEQWPVPLRTALRILLTTNHPVFVFWGPQLICFYNDAFSRSLGPEKHPAMLGANGRDVWAEIWEIIGPQIERVMAGEGATWHENQLVPITRHGQREDVYWTYSYSPIDDESSATGVGGVLVLCTETTQQVRTTERLKAAEARWRALFDQAPGFMCILDGPQHRFTFANPGYFELIGQRDIIGRTVGEVLPWAVEQGYVALLDQVYRDGVAHLANRAQAQVPLVGLRFLDFVYQPIRDEQGVVTGIFLLGFDVTERESAVEALLVSEERLRMARDAAALGTFDYAFDNDEIRWDGRMREIWGIAAGETITYDAVMAGIHVDDRALVEAALQRATNPAGDGRFFAEYRVVHRQSKAVRWVHSTASVTFAGGVAARMVGMVQDVSELKAADARRNEFLATLGHELRNPLAPIRNAVELLKLQPTMDEPARRAHGIIERQVNQLVRLIDDLLDAVRISRGRLELRKERMSLASVVTLAVEAAQPHIDRGKHTLDVALPSSPVYLYADAVRLAQVFSNLLINSCKYSDHGTPIELRARLVGNSTVEVDVIDRGIGIEPTQLKQVFEMFSQADVALHRAQGGLGIGLALAHGLVQLHGGSIEAFSEGAGKGSRFVVRLPVQPAESAPTIASSVGSTAANPVAGRRVLVVDDNEDAALTMAALMQAQGATTQVAHDGQAAIDMAASFAPDIVLLDIGLPRINGYQVCRTLREATAGGSLCIIALTGWGQQGDRASSRDAGFDAHLVKPVDIEQLNIVLAERAG